MVHYVRPTSSIIGRNDDAFLERKVNRYNDLLIGLSWYHTAVKVLISIPTHDDHKTTDDEP